MKICNKIRILLIENDIDFVYLIRNTIEHTEDIHFCTYAETALAGLELARSLNPDIVLTDLNLSGNQLDGIGVSRKIRLSTNAKVLLLTSFEEPSIIISASKESFASGYIFKSQCRNLCEIIRETAAGTTVQERFIQELILQELSSAERTVFDMMLGRDVEILSSEKTIANQKTAIFKKLGLKNQHELLHIFQP
ncbi:response regulator [Merdimonas faecis]|uniref:response regulator n=1 Tax=Merdimonas faecis TaxID=1653435 RepID=UPI0023F63FE6|nr:response regulator [Merdimonas faecis]